MRRILLLTATITPPPGVPGLIRADPVDRERDYCDAITRLAPLIASDFDHVVFAENSASCLDRIRECTRLTGIEGKTEFCSFYGLDYPVVRGRAYGEFKLVQHAVEHAETLRDFSESDQVWKLTGRYRVVNFAKFLRNAPRRFDYYCDLKNRPRPWADFRIFAFNRIGYERYLLPLIDVVAGDRPSFVGEQAARPFLQQFVGREGFYARFRSEPLVQGIRGFDNTDYADLRNRYKFLLRSAARTFAPFVWI